MIRCAWCRQTFALNTIGRPRRYCSVGCRRAHGHYVEALPGWQARLARLEADAAGSRSVPVFIRNEIDWLRVAINAPNEVSR